MKEIETYEEYLNIILDAFNKYSIGDILITLVFIIVFYFLGKRRG